MRPLFFLLMLSLICACSENSVGPIQTENSEDYFVYSTLLREHFHNSDLTLVVEDSTGSMEILETSFDRFIENIEGVTTELLHSFNEINTTKIALKKIPDIDHIFVSEHTGDMHNIVILTLSRVAFNSETTKALVMLGEYYAPLAGEGTMFLLEKSSDGWIITASAMVWIS